MQSKRTLAVIIARGGSKRIPRKNIKDFLGVPIIKYSIDAARLSGCFTEIMVSTDDKEIAEVARNCGAAVPFLRSPLNSSDVATTADAVKEVLLQYKNAGQEFDYTCCLYSTAPFMTAKNLKRGFELLQNKKVEAVVPVVRFGYPIQRAFEIKNNELQMMWPENLQARSQDLPAAYHDAGQFYWLKTAAFLKQNKLFCEHTLPLELAELEVQDIDTEEDWKIAELKYKILSNK